MARRKKDKKSLLISLIVVIILAVFATNSEGIIPEKGGYTLPEGSAYVHFIDIGQGSATLVTCGDKTILIDTGEKDYSSILIRYINSCGVDKLDYVIASHPHSDHIGGMADVISSFSIGTFLMPELTERNIPDTRVYERMIDALVEKEVNSVYSEFGDKYTLCDGVTFEFFGPCEQTDDLNNMSAIVKLSVNGTDFMLLADAERQELSSVYEAYPYADYKADVLAMGHHGSSTSIHTAFLKAVDADVAVISCGRNNSYGHPHKEALDYINNNKLTAYRTDLDGDIVFECDADGYRRYEKK